MTVSTTTSRADYTGNGVATAFTVPFYFLDSTHLTVLRTDTTTGISTTLVLTTDYSVTGAGVPAGGTVTLTSAPTASQKISILRNVPFTQLTDYVENDPFPAASHEMALDKLTMVVQQINEAISRALTLPASTTGVSTLLPTAQPLYLLGFNSAGNAITSYNPETLLTVAGSSGFAIQQFSGTGAQTSFTLSDAPGAVSNLEVFISGVRQQPTADYTVSGQTLTFVSAPALGTNNIFVRWGQTLGIGVPSDSSVTNAKLAQNAVLTANIQDQAITAVKLAQNAVLTANIQDQAITTNKLADGAANGVKLGSKIQSLTATNNAGALTISASALSLDFRSTTLSVGTPGTVTGTPSNLVIPSGATLGTINGVQSDLIVLAINNAGTIELAVVNLSGGNQLDETNLISTTAISAGSTSASVIYSTTARSNVAYRVLGLLRSTQSTAGVWTTTQSLLQGYGGQALSAMSSFGFGQTWQSVTRNSGTTYYNTTGKPIILCGSTASSTTVFATINGVQHGNCVTPAGANNYVSWVIPAGASYVVSGTLGTTLELR